MINKTKADLIFVYLAYSLRYLYLLLLIPFYARVLGPEGYGVVLAALSLMQMIWLFTNWGFSIDGTREIATAKPEDYGALFNKHFSARLLLSTVAIVLGAAAIYFSDVLANNMLAGIFAVLLGIVSAFNLGWYFTGSHRPRKAVKLEALGFMLNLVLILSLVRNESHAHLAIGAILLSGTIALLLAHQWIAKEINNVKVNFHEGWTFVKSTRSIFIYSSSALLLGASSTYLLSTFSTTTEVGLFGSAERLVSVGLSLMAPLGAIFIPKVTVLLKENTQLAFTKVRMILLGLVSIGMLGYLLSTLLGDWVVLIIFGEAFTGSVEILQRLSMIFPFYALSLVLGTYVLIPLHHEKLLAKITLLGTGINIMLAIPLALEFGGLGMATARVVSEVFICSYLIISCYQLGLFQKIIRPVPA